MKEMLKTPDMDVKLSTLKPLHVETLKSSLKLKMVKMWLGLVPVLQE